MRRANSLLSEYRFEEHSFSLSRFGGLAECRTCPELPLRFGAMSFIETSSNRPTNPAAPRSLAVRVFRLPDHVCGCFSEVLRCLNG